MKLTSLVSMMSVLLFTAAGSVLMAGCASVTDNGAPATAPAQTIENIPPVEAHALIQANAGNDDFVIVDVRTPGEFSEGHIEGALNINLNSGEFEAEIDKLEKDKTYLVYCRSGVRSARARDIMAGLGFTNLYNMTGGIADWSAEGFPDVN